MLKQRVCILTSLLVLAGGANLLGSGCGASKLSGRSVPDSYFRMNTPRQNSTIFSPINMPAANSVRNGAGVPGPDYWQQQVDYVINASLDAETRLVNGSATITYTNNSPDDLDYIWLHLEQNIFRHDSIAAAIAANTAIGVRTPEGVGYTIHTVNNSGKEIGIKVYDTMGRIDLEESIPAHGGKFEFNIEWDFTIPKKAFRRFGIEKVEQGTIYELAQWFPAVAVYDDVYGWNTLPYLGTGEFYTNFGNYDVKLTVPRSHLVVATGVLQNPVDVYTDEQMRRLSTAKNSDDTVVIRTAEEVDDPSSRPAGIGQLTWHYIAEDVRTFAWASSDAYIYDGCNLEGTFIQSAYPKEGLPNWSKSTQMLRTSIKGYNKRWFRYPYPSATNVNGPEGGMEYPMIIFCGGRRSERGLYGVTTHEIGHNWFPMIVNTDERRHAWMDEGFNTFINYYSTGEWFEGEMGRRGNAASFVQSMLQENLYPIMTYADQLPRNLLGQLQYAKTAVGLVLLREQILGPERFDHAFRTYIKRWAFKSPRPSDFFRCMEDAAGADLAWFWRGWFMETSYLDQAITSLTREGDNITVSIVNMGELVMPVNLHVKYEDGSEDTHKLPVEIWFNTNLYSAKWKTTKQIEEVVVDIDSGYPDVDRTNNTWPR